MKRLIGLAATAALLMAARLHGTQEGAKVIKLDDFESELSGWSSLTLDESGIGEDAEAKIAVAREAGQVKSGKGSLSYSYQVAPNKVRVLALQKGLDLSGMKSLRLWVKCSKATAVVIGLTEAGGASYQASLTCAAGAWQELSVNLDELSVDDPAKDGNGKLDLDQVGSFTVLDLGSFLATFLPELAGPRVLWLDDVSFSSKPVRRTTGRAEITKVVPVHLVDTFETPVNRWAPISLEFSDPPKFALFDAPVAIDASAPKGGGKQSLMFTYPRRGTKFHGLMRSVEKDDLSKARGLDLWTKTSTDGTFILTLEEKDGSRYQRTLELKADDGWKAHSLGLDGLTLADDSQDENGRLDPGEIKQISIGDITPLAGGAEADETRLWIDEVMFLLAP